MFAADEMHSVTECLPPPGSDVLVFWASTGVCIRAKYADRIGGPRFQTRDTGNQLTPTHWAFFHPPKE